MWLVFMLFAGGDVWDFGSIPKKCSIRGISVVDSKTLWISGSESTIALTEDGAQTWRLFDMPEGLDFRDIECVSARETYAMSAGPGRQSQIFKTSDGGKSWQCQFVNQFEAGFFNAIAFWDPQRGVALSDPLDGTHYLLGTVDGGAHWTRVDYTKIPATLEGEYGFAASGTNLIVSGDSQLWIATGGLHARLFQSPDFGDTWSAQTTEVQSGLASSGLFSVAFMNEVHGVAVGGDYEKPELVALNAIYTADGGKSWQPAVNQTSYRSCVRFFPGTKHVLAVGRSGCSYSKDAGVHWQDMGSQGFYSLDISEDGSAWAAGAEGVVARFKQP